MRRRRKRWGKSEKEKGEMREELEGDGGRVRREKGEIGKSEKVTGSGFSVGD